MRLKYFRRTASVSRREFVGRVSAVTGFLTLTQPAVGQLSSRGKLGVALCGLGNYARGQLGPALKLTQNCELRGVVTGSPEKGAAWAKEYGFPAKNVYHYDTMARFAENPDIDIVYAVTPNALGEQFKCLLLEKYAARQNWRRAGQATGFLKSVTETENVTRANRARPLPP